MGEHLERADKGLLASLMKDLYQRGSTIDTTPTIFWRLNSEEENKVETYEHAEMPLCRFREAFGKFQPADLFVPEVSPGLSYQMRGSETTAYLLSGLHALIDKGRLEKITGVEILNSDFARIGHFRHELQEFDCPTFGCLESIGVKAVPSKQFMEKGVAYTVDLGGLPVSSWCDEFHEESEKSRIGKLFSFDPCHIPGEVKSLTVKGKADMFFTVGDFFGVYDFKRLYGGYYPIEKVSKQVCRYIASAVQLMNCDFPGFVRVSAHTRLNQKPGWHAKPLHHIVYYPNADRFYEMLHRDMLKSCMLKFELMSRGNEFYLDVLDNVVSYLEGKGVPEYDIHFSSPYSWFDFQDGTCRAMKELIRMGKEISDVLLPGVKLV